MAWVVPACFGLSCFLTLLAIVVLVLRGFDDMRTQWMFSIGADIFCMAICTMLCFSATLNTKESNADTRAFVSLLTANAIALFLDELCWIVQGIPNLKVVNLITNVLFYMTGAILIYMFWEYIRRALKLTDRPMVMADWFVTGMLVPSLLLCLINFFYPLFFTVDENGVYSRTGQWDVSQIYLSITLTVVIIAILFAKASKKDRFVAISFIAIPMVNQIFTISVFGLSTQYAAMTVSIVLIYGVLFADREKTLASTEMELGVATKIQANMLPNNFPYLPERTEFDLYASMSPAKDVGGDFYDFFMVDDTHLAMVIADVSGKGIPAALFMMRSKASIRSLAETGSSPGEIFYKVNNLLCEGNDADMFVTAWIGIVDLTTGEVCCANAGHEYPVLKRVDGSYEIVMDRHGLPLAAMEEMWYTEYYLTLGPGDKLFLYTDGVPEAINENEEQYGTNRMLAALNTVMDEPMENTLFAVRNDMSSFVGKADQFDDITMLGFMLHNYVSG